MLVVKSFNFTDPRDFSSPVMDLVSTCPTQPHHRNGSICDCIRMMPFAGHAQGSIPLNLLLGRAIRKDTKHSCRLSTGQKPSWLEPCCGNIAFKFLKNRKNRVRARKLLNELLKDYKNPEDLLGENGLIKQLTKALVETALESEITQELGYEKND